MKTCNKCGEAKSLSEFYKHAAMLDGYLNACKACVKSRVLKHRVENIDAIREYDRSRADLPHRVAARAAYAETEVGQSKMLAGKLQYKEKFPLRVAANNAVANALRDGRLVRQPCFMCGEFAEGHHPDYSRPLDVVWLCDKDHKATHKLGRAIDRAQKKALQNGI